ncbi:ATP-grasp fold amidoligase family protein [Algoriphagus formosus]|uniref:ATP-grasp fold amidoligase family protein n=1 Tax=Algoriphagus formosus TaxID=2007308 RepID=UPI000C282627|nr:ATP-grasp fold amidoligase family protein [Algoriphagus formosus]
MNIREVFRKGYPQNLKDRLLFSLEKARDFPKIHRIFERMVGYPLDLKNPITHNQRIFFKKIYDRNPLLVITSDKVKVRDYIKEKLGKEAAEELLIPTYFVSKTGDDIPMDSWNHDFFMKANHASGFNKYVSTTDDPKGIKDLAKSWLAQSYGQHYLEWAYRDIPRRVICEQVLVDERGKIPMDIKFYCFHGKVKMIMFLDDRFGDQGRIFTDENLNEIPGSQMMGSKKLWPVPKLPTFQKMKEISEKLSEDFSYCRIDLYSIGTQVFFGEITHYTGSGLEKFDEYDTDFTFGEFWKPENKDLNFFELYEKIKISPNSSLIIPHS